MKTKAIILLACLMLSFQLTGETFPVPQGEFQPLTYTAFRTTEKISVDGKLAETSWTMARPTELFVDIEGDLKPRPHLSTRARLLWDEEALYIAAEMQEPHLWATLTQRDDIIFWDNDFEVFLDPDGDTHDYYEMEINALNTMWDLFIKMPYRDDHSSLHGWNLKDAEWAVGLRGSLNDPTDTDIGWFLEMRLPWHNFAEFAHKPCPPREGDFWRLNFSRVQWDLEVVDGKYAKVPGKPEHNWVWSPQGLIAMHYPERWGYLFFSEQAVGSTDPYFDIPAGEFEREYLRQIYYKQKQYKMDHGRWAKSLRQLGVQPLLREGKKVKPRLETTSQDWVVTLPKGKNLPETYIRGDGRIWSKAEQH